jgi:hypothetical protein
MLRHSPTSGPSIQRQRSLRLECLEDRNMLSHPAVAAVNLASTQWAPSFVAYLESAKTNCKRFPGKALTKSASLSVKTWLSRQPTFR